MKCKLVIRADDPPVTGYADEGVVLAFDDLEALVFRLQEMCEDADFWPYTEIRAYIERLERGAALAAGER